MSELKESSRGEGVQVLFVEEDGRYRCDESALRRVASSGAARGLPVAVVSVAGATRGGKSFLLDFFLRYLRAPKEARRSGAWLGADDEPLTGFSWRGGWERNTTGILLWSEPLIVSYVVDGHKKKIAVLLMDTQGTFDNTSTVKDCTTIFAMSTLMSSVQIYNLSQIIKEDDLQHLQLFTEYGKLAQKHEDAKPFQSLIFRVRDWMCPYEHPYGAKGGANYLKTILQAETKKTEIKELRDHIRSSFETVSCFLTPHPGMVVANQNFSGRLCDLQPEFKDALLEFVPLILHPSNLIPKIINGRVVTTGEFPTYFRTYLEIFNGDDLPTPVSIFQATSAANLETALCACREEYVAHMDRSVGGTVCVPRGAVARYHAAALHAARQAFAARRTLAAPALATARLDVLLQELDASLPDYEAINRAKVLKAVSESRETYDAKVRGARRDARPLCLHPLDAPVLHAGASAAAMAVYDTIGPPQGEDEDPDRNEMLQWLDAKGKELLASNELSNTTARAAAGAVYAEHVQRASRNGALSGERLRSEHGTARNAALAAMRAARSRPSNHADDDDCYLMALVTKIDEEFLHWERTNSKSNRSALRSAVAEYGARMSSVWGPHACLHPRALQRDHEAARAAAWDELRAETAAEYGGQEQQQLYEALESRYKDVVRANEAANEALVTTSYAEYCRRMDSKCAPSLTSILIVPWLIKVLVQLPKYHEDSCKEARAHFRSRRRAGPSDDDDNYLERLNEKLSNSYEVYCNPLHALAREFNVPLPS